MSQIDEKALPEPDPRLRRWAVATAALCVAGLAITWVVADLVPAARIRDIAALRGYIDLGSPGIDRVANGVLDLIGPIQGAAFCLLLGLVAVARGRPRLALAVPVVMLGAILSADALKPLLPHTQGFISGTYNVSPDSWPSGHASEAMAMALSAVLVAPRRWRVAVAAAGGVFALAVGFSLLTLAWHMPSDVVGGYLMGGLWMSLAMIGLEASQARWPARSGRRAVSSAGRALRDGASARGSGGLAVAILAVAALIVVLLSRTGDVMGFAAGHHSLVAFSAVISVLAVALVSGLVLALRR